MRRALLLLTAATLAMSACTSPEATNVTPTQEAPTATAAAEPFVTGLTIPWAVGGKRQFLDGTVRTTKGEWPKAHVPAIRLWDTFTTWANLEPKRNQWRFGRLDRFVNAAIKHGTTDITLVLAGTPRWAATEVRETDAPWIGPGSASFPKDIQLWRTYVRKVVTRYAGRITSYEIGNEPNLPMFWTGTPEQWRQLTEVATQEISAIDPDAEIIGQVGLVRRPKDVPAITAYTRAIGDVAGIDVLSVHTYPRARRLDESTRLLTDTMAAVKEADPQAAANRPVWVTEVNVSRAAHLDKAEQAQAVATLNQQIAQAGFARAYWYSWTIEGAPGLVPLHPGSPASGALLGAMGDSRST